MDFANLMKSQISASQSKVSGTEDKYLKRSEIEAQRRAKYLREQEELEAARLERIEKKRRREEEEAERNRLREEKRQRLAEEGREREAEERKAEERERRRRLGLPDLVARAGDGEKKESEAESEEADMAEEVVLQKLQALGEPRRLFGETHEQRIRRYTKLTSIEKPPVMSNGPIPTSLELVAEEHMKVPDVLPSDTGSKLYLLRQIASYFDMVLSEWELALLRRPKEIKESVPGRQAHNHFLAARDNLIPLFRKLEATFKSLKKTSSSSKKEDNVLPDTLLAPILEIVNLAQLKHYVKANDAYLRLSIGKAAWPIGVTMVGIHERSAREKLHESDNKAHIMSDETTRKMLQGMKRCLSFAQTRWPPDDAGQLMG